MDGSGDHGVVVKKEPGERKRDSRDAVRAAAGPHPDPHDTSTTENEDDDSDSESGSDSEDSGSNSDHSTGSSASSKSAQSNASSKKSEDGSSERSDASHCHTPAERSKADSDATNDVADDVYASSRKSRGRASSDLKEMINSNPDMYGVRRSCRSRKEPDRYTTADADDSDASDPERRPPRRKHAVRKGSNEWGGSAGDSDATGSSCASPRPSSHRKTGSRSATSRLSVRKNKRIRVKDVLKSSSEDSDDDTEEDTRTTRRNNKLISYKEQSDHTDSEDLVEQEIGDYQEVEEEGIETIEKVLSQRMGTIGATGPRTTMYNVEANGDPNACDLVKVGDGRHEEERELQFYIKWKNKSHLHATWESETSLREMRAKGLKKLENFVKREEELKQWKDNATPEDIEYYDCQEEMMDQLSALYLRVDRIIAHQPSKSTETHHPQYLCKWEGLSYADCTFEDGSLIAKKYPHKIEEYHNREKSVATPSKLCKVLKQRPRFSAVKAQPKFIGSHDPSLILRDYQLDGLNWLLHSWCRENSVILADEMGLGKTIQTICFFNYLFHEYQLYGPFLVVVPLSTMASWQKEFTQWAPEMNVVVYIGDVQSRNMIRSYEWCHPGNKRLKFNVLLTTYEILLKDKGFLGSYAWAILSVDEAHRLKNDDSLLYKTLIEFDTNHRILITGTPLQNSLRELWALLHFIMPNKFAKWEDFEADHADADRKGYAKLHKELEPYLLRRVKKDVEKSLPAKVEQILRVEMTSIQKTFYKYILTKNYQALAKGMKGSLTGFANIMMELKKCCNHAALIRHVDELNHLDRLTSLLRGSGKLFLLDKLLCRLNATGHRVLIFSQMVRMLDIMSDYLTLRRFPFQRLDGSIKGELRKQALDHFNAEGSPDFCFLLSTRAGGLGINLATADTVIIFDSDWNPQNDLQAQARAHRIGQKNQVNIYRLVTKGSVEEDILERAKQKMVLDHLVIQRMDTTGKTVLSSSKGTSSSSATPFNKEELAQILKFGAEDLFKENEDAEDEPNVDIDEILRRAETREEVNPNAGHELLNAFKMASFNFNEEDVKPAAANKAEKDWDQIIPEEDRAKIEALEKKNSEMQMFLGPRNRKTAQPGANEQDSGEEYDPAKKGDDSDDSDAENRPGKKRGGRQSRSSRAAGGRDGDDRKGINLKGFTETEIRKFIKSYKKFPAPMKRLDAVALDSELQDKPMPDLKRLAEDLQSGCEKSVKEHLEKLTKEALNDEVTHSKKRGDRGPSFKLYGVSVFPKNLLSCQQELEPLELMLPVTADERKRWILPCIVKDVKDWDIPWTTSDDAKLLAAVFEYGMGSWEAIKMDPTYCLADKILPDGDLKPQAKHLTSRVEHLLKMLQRKLTAEKLLSEKASGKKKAGTKGESHKNGKDKHGKSVKSSDGSRKSSKKSKTGDKEAKKDAKVKKEKRKKDKKKKSSKRDVTGPAMHYTATAAPAIVDADLDPAVFAACKEKMRPVKKMLKRLDNELDKSKELDCLVRIGNRISKCLEEYQKDGARMKEWRTYLWTFVSKFSDHSPKRLYKMYKKAAQQQKSSPSLKSSNSHHSIPLASSSSHRQSASPSPHYHQSNPSAPHHFMQQGQQQQSGSRRPANALLPTPPLKRGRYESEEHHHMHPFVNSHGPPLLQPPARGPIANSNSGNSWSVNNRGYDPSRRPYPPQPSPHHHPGQQPAWK